MKLGLIYFPSVRADLYLKVLSSLKIRLSTIVVLNNEFKQPEITKSVFESDKRYIEEGYSLKSYLSEFDSEVVYTNSNSINDDKAVDSINISKENTWLYTGGGILKKELFNHGNRYLHIHPGELPLYRGSTCFYYSLLDSVSLSASAFYLSPALDEGQPVKICHFSVTLDTTTATSHFLDYVVDPWMRAMTLKAFLEEGSEDIQIGGSEQAIKRHYYVMHPVLRALAIRKTLNASPEREIKGLVRIE